MCEFGLIESKPLPALMSRSDDAVKGFV